MDYSQKYKKNFATRPRDEPPRGTPGSHRDRGSAYPLTADRVSEAGGASTGEGPPASFMSKNRRV